MSMKFPCRLRLRECRCLNKPVSSGYADREKTGGGYVGKHLTALSWPPAQCHVRIVEPRWRYARGVGSSPKSFLPAGRRSRAKIGLPLMPWPYLNFRIPQNQQRSAGKYWPGISDPLHLSGHRVISSHHFATSMVRQPMEGLVFDGVLTRQEKP
jgi:hypothetical protein